MKTRGKRNLHWPVSGCMQIFLVEGKEEMGVIRVVKQKTRGFLKRGVNTSIRFVRKIKISTRLVSLFVLSSFLPLLLIGTWIYRQTSNTLYKNVNKTIESMADQTASYISEKMLKVISDSVEISNSENVQNILRNYASHPIDHFQLKCVP